jgi:hypothetical protein
MLPNRGRFREMVTSALRIAPALLRKLAINTLNVFRLFLKMEQDDTNTLKYLNHLPGTRT